MILGEEKVNDIAIKRKISSRFDDETRGTTSKSTYLSLEPKDIVECIDIDR